MTVWSNAAGWPVSPTNTACLMLELNTAVTLSLSWSFLVSFDGSITRESHGFHHFKAELDNMEGIYETLIRNWNMTQITRIPQLCMLSWSWYLLYKSCHNSQLFLSCFVIFIVLVIQVLHKQISCRRCWLKNIKMFL